LSNTKGWAKGQFSADSKGQDARMVRFTGDDSDKYFVPITDTINTSATYSAKTVLFATVNSGSAAGNYELTIVTNWEAIPSLSSTQFVDVRQAQADPATFERAMNAGSSSSAANPLIVTSPEKSSSDSHKLLGDMAKSAVGVIGDVSSGDFTGAAKKAVSALSDLPGALSEGVDFLASAVGSLFGMSSHAELFFRSTLFVSGLREDEFKELLGSIQRLEAAKVLPSFYSSFLNQLYRSKIVLRHTNERLPQPTGTSFVSDGKVCTMDCVVNPRIVCDLLSHDETRPTSSVQLSTPAVKPLGSNEYVIIN